MKSGAIGPQTFLIFSRVVMLCIFLQNPFRHKSSKPNIKEVDVMKKVLSLVLLIMVLVVVPVSATPSGIIWIPSTDIQASGKTHFGIDSYFTLKPLQSGESTGAFTTPAVNLTWGAKDFEFGVDYVTSQKDPFYFNAKAKLLGKKATDLNLAAGVYNLGTTSLTNQEVKYLLASIAAKDGTRFSFGYGIGRKKSLGDDYKMIMASIDKQLNDKWWVAVDYQGGKSSLGALNFGVAYNFAPNASLLLAYDIYNNKEYKNTMSLQLDINF